MEPAASSEDAGVSEGKIYSSIGFGRGWFLKDDVQTPKGCRLGTPRFSSTRVQAPPPPCGLQTPETESNVGTPQAGPQVDLSTLISELANQIGQSIADKLKDDKNVSESVLTGPCHSEQKPSELNLSGVKFIMQSDVREPPVFRGDGSDKCSVREWVDMVERYLMKRNVPKHQQSQEILARLMGKAKDVVKVTLRHNSALDPIQTPELIFDILKEHFGELSYSSIPMADFYNTKPFQHEGVMEYWIRLNNAVDVADECLKRQGRSVEDPGREVSMMFIKYCPDTVLSNRLSIKAAEEWTTSEVQERIDHFQRELRTRTQVSRQAPQRHSGSHAQTVMSQGGGTPQPVQQQPQTAPAATFCTAQTSALAPQLSPTAAQFTPAPTTASQKMVPSPAECALTTQLTQSPAYPSAAQPGFESAMAAAPGVDMNGMRTLLSLLDRMMTHQNVQVAAPAPTTTQQANSRHFQRRDCKVCGDSRHSTVMHCRRENLCLSCFSTGHWKRDCNRYGQRQMDQAAPKQDQPSGN